MSDKQTDQQTETDQDKNNNKWRPESANPQHLMGKVVLLIGNDTAVVQNLVTQLAQKGADIALVCWQMPQEAVRKIKESVQAVGRHLLLIEQTEPEHEASVMAQLVETIAAELGHLDIFIDLSAHKSEPLSLSNGHAHKVTAGQPNWPLAQAVLEEMVRA